MKQAGGYRLLGFYHLLSALLFILLLMTLGGFLPLLAPMCTHPSFVWVVLLPIWFSTVYMSLKASFSGFLMSLSPAGVPGYISPVLFFFEVVSILVRPVSLSLRLVANMVVGHILFSWHWREVALEFTGFSMGSEFLSLKFFGFLLLNCLHLWWESAVCVFQSFVAVGLLSLYSEDVVKSKFD
uniref:ATP synthase F0 subunit 6 n=1 Tax=Cardita variegata TaxID=740991 RepID=UPI00286A2F5F|nr:ATP synthase F0 subunit 6 [Cardita variegata]WLW42336.1 ATP synthase F0 subunit 6 [Cardita variegata]